MKPMVVALLMAAGCAKKAPDTPHAAGGAPGDEVARSEEDPAAAPLVDRELLLWRVERDGVASHLMGTCHLPMPLEAFLPPEHEATLTGARALYTEADVSDMTAHLGLLFGGDSLRDRLGAEGWSRLLDRLPAEIPAPFVDRARPWLAYGMMQTKFPGAGVQPAATPATAVDQAVVRRAEGAGVERRYLESLEFQVQMLSDMEDELLRFMSGDPEAEAEAARSAAMTAALCSDGDLQGVEAMLEEGASGEGAGFIERMFLERNRRWAETLAPELEQGGLFVAVGAGHMPGRDGLLELVQAQGYEVTRLRGEVPKVEAPLADPSPERLIRDPQRVAAWQAALEPMVGAVCVAGNPIHDCFAPDTVTCGERVRSDLGLCLEQRAPTLPAPGGQPDVELITQLIGCASTGMMAEALGEDRPMEGPVCQQMQDQIKAGFSTGVTGG